MDGYETVKLNSTGGLRLDQSRIETEVAAHRLQMSRRRESGRRAVARPPAILLVEDELGLRASIRVGFISELDLEFARVCRAKSEALQVIETTSLELVLVGLNLSDGSGLDVVRAVKQLQPLCKVFVMGTADDKDGIVSSMKVGASGYLLNENVTRSERAHRGSTVSSVASSRVLRNVYPAKDAHKRKEIGISQLSAVQGDVLRCVARGLSNKEIARNLLMSSYNVDYHLRCLRKRFLVRNRVQLIGVAMTYFQI